MKQEYNIKKGKNGNELKNRQYRKAKVKEKSK
jgi:hypothetical protein